MGKSGATNDLSSFRIISLTLHIRKLYHTLEAQRTMDFMVANKYLDPAAQKAFMDGVNGCVEHVTVIQEIIQNATHNHKTVHITWFDLEDAFGSVSHMLIPITSLYSKLEGQIKTKNWESDIFKFLKGFFQGDPHSGVIFMIIFNSIIEYSKKHQETQGYELKTETSALFVTLNNSGSKVQILSVLEKNMKFLGS